MSRTPGPDHDDDGYLWDRSAPVDPDVAALEALLGRFRHRARRPSRRAGRAAWLAAAVLLIGALVVWRVPDGGAPEVFDPAAVRLAIGAPDGPSLRPGRWLEPTAREASLFLGDLGEVVLEPGSRLQARVARIGRIELFLAAGALEAIVAEEAAPGLFRVSTPVTTCVDLGCRYRLAVEPDSGESVVVVTLGKVAFESGNRRVIVPRRAEARARSGGWLGTPRSIDAPADFDAAIDSYDSADVGSEARLAAATTACGIATMDIDTLPLWHMLADPDDAVRRVVEGRLIREFGAPEGWAKTKGGLPIPRDVWLEHLEPFWY